MRLLVIGESGQLAQALARGGDVVNAGRRRLDLSNASVENAQALMRESGCDVVINAAAYTAVDRAEADRAVAYALNEGGPRTLAQACKALNTPLVHVSTDYVFDGDKATPYTETDVANPQCVYGASKAAGERAVLESGARAAIVRTSWLFSAGGDNFVRTMLRLAQTQEEVAVVSDQIGRPTWAADLAAACRAIGGRLANGDTAAEGILHFANSGEASWADFAEAIFENARARGWSSARVRRISGADFPSAAKRPANSRLDTAKYSALFGAPRPWREALPLCLDEMAPPKTA